jgi:hypothetical protein
MRRPRRTGRPLFKCPALRTIVQPRAYARSHGISVIQVVPASTTPPAGGHDVRCILGLHTNDKHIETVDIYDRRYELLSAHDIVARNARLNNDLSIALWDNARLLCTHYEFDHACGAHAFTEISPT